MPTITALKELVTEFMRVHQAFPTVTWEGAAPPGCVCTACSRARAMGFEAPQLAEQKGAEADAGSQDPPRRAKGPRVRGR